MRADQHPGNLPCHPKRGIASAALALLVFLLPLPVSAQSSPPDIRVRAGNHRDYGRLVFDFPRLVAFHSSQDGAVLVVDFAAPSPIAEPAWLPRNVTSFAARPGEARITVPSGATAHVFRVGTRVVIDVPNPAPGAPAKAIVAPKPAPELVAAALPMPPPAIPLPLPPAPESAAQPAMVAPPVLKVAAIAPPVVKVAASVPPVANRRPALAAALPPGPVPAVPHPATPHPATPHPATPHPATAPAPPPRPAALARSAAAAVGDAVPATELGPLAIAAERVAAPPGSEAALLVPFGPRTGAAAFRRGGDGIVVFDRARPIDMSGLAGDPAFGAARVTLLPAGTVIRLPLPPTLRLDLFHRDEGWVIGITRAPSAVRAITSTVAAGALSLPLATAAQVVLVPDAISGTNLLIGTAHVPGAGIAVTRRLPGFVLLRTWLGVAVVPLTDRLVLDHGVNGFSLSADGGLALASEPVTLTALESAATLTRRFEFPALPLTVMARRLHQELDAVVAAAPGSRFAARLAEAQTLIALGMGPEAAALIKLAEIDDPRHAGDATATGLAAIAAILSGRLDQSAGLDDPRLSGSDEIALWRAARAALLDQDPAGTAPVFAATSGLILAYPEPLRAFLAPIAAEAMVEGGKQRVAGEFLKDLPVTPALDFDRALLLAAHGKTKAVLAAWDRLSHSLDRRVAARAASRLVLLRLASGQIGPRAAADALSRQFYDWRGGRHELKLRLEVARLYANAGEWREALALLRQTEQLFPTDAAAVRNARAATFRHLFAGDAVKTVPPLDLVSLIEDNADLIPPGLAGEKLGLVLAGRLMALDLPDRAEPVLEKLMAAAPEGAPRAGLGAELAEVRLERQDPAGALKALGASRAADLPHDLAVRRTLIFARAVARQGDTGKAVAALTALDDPAASLLAAELLQKSGRWSGAETELARVVAATVPQAGALSQANRTVLIRLASAAAQVQDAPELARLRQSYGPRMGEDSLGNMFRLLTDPPAASLGDLPEVGRETAIAGQLPRELKAIGATMHVVP